MQTYIAILRGINVSGQKIIKMAELRAHLAALGFTNLTTYIQSGNIVFKTETTETSVLEDKIHQNIKANYGFDVPVIVRSKSAWKQVVMNDPFKGKNYDINRLAVVFLKEKPTLFDKSVFDKFFQKDDEMVLIGNEIFLHIPGGFGNAKISNNLIENKLKITATTRNWKTTHKLLSLAEVL